MAEAIPATVIAEGAVVDSVAHLAAVVISDEVDMAAVAVAVEVAMGMSLVTVF